MPKKKSSIVVAQEPPVVERSVLRAIGGKSSLVPVEAIFYVPTSHPDQVGPWGSEPDKVAWIDENSGLHCIIRRAANTGCWEGFVGIGPTHPFFGWTVGALVGRGIQVHGGIDYASPCQHQLPEAVSVCHVHVSHAKAILGDGQADRSQAEAWWFGFSCSHETDIWPTLHYKRIGDLTESRVYRDEAFAYGQCVHLAAQLQALGAGKDLRALNWRHARTSSVAALPASKGGDYV